MDIYRALNFLTFMGLEIKIGTWIFFSHLSLTSQGFGLNWEQINFVKSV
jgi:hypothetical protein